MPDQPDERDESGQPDHSGPTHESGEDSEPHEPGRGEPDDPHGPGAPVAPSQADGLDRRGEPNPSRNARTGSDPGSEALLDARMLRGLAHPVRVQMLGLLRDAGPATATTLARQLGLNTGATSYHLRQLAAHGFVVEDTQRGKTRERWWRPAHSRTRCAPTASGGDDRVLGDAYLRAIGLQYAGRIENALDGLPTVPERWRPTLSDFRLRVTSDELEELLTRVGEVISRYRHEDAADNDSAPADAAPVVVQLQAFARPGALSDGRDNSDTDRENGDTRGPAQDDDAAGG